MSFKILQGTNSPFPITLESSVTDAIDVHFGIYDKNHSNLIHWTKDEMTIDDAGTGIELPISQSQSLAFPAGEKCTLEGKWTDTDGVVHFADIIDGVIVRRSDTHTLNEEVVTDE